MNHSTKANPLGLTLLLFLLLVIYSSCDNCSDVACFTPPQPFLFDFVDSTGTNVFEAGTYTLNNISLKDNISNDRIEFDIIDNNIIRINTIGWESEEINYSFNLGTPNDIDFTVTAERVSEECCSFTRMTDFSIKDYPFSVSNETGITTVTL